MLGKCIWKKKNGKKKPETKKTFAAKKEMGSI